MSNVPKIFTRLNTGLIQGINYNYDENGLINWRKLVPSEYLVPNKLRTQETDITKLPDSDLLILLSGLKYLAYIRGFSNVSYNVYSASDNYCCCKCSITWIPNIETENRSIYFEAIADAHLNNTENFAKNYLSSIAENRAFSRAVRSFLRIAIVSDEEINKDGDKQSSNEISNSAQLDLLQKAMKKKHLTFDILKEKMVAENIPGANNLTKIEELSKEQIFGWLQRIKKYKPETE